ncbi:MAG: hypothetical protein JWO41_185 [Candidatus Saccharibacteria bacterium]|nr:hypothetical protein [Candidatus Saccharibacteria bacterium]
MDDQDIQNLADQLKQFEPGFLPYPIFEQVARIVALPIVEFVPLRRQGDSIQVLLIRRPANDPIFPGMEHTPGTVIRATDASDGQQDSWAAFDRILKDELQGTSTGDPHYVGSMFHHSKRGAEQAQIYWVEVSGESAVGTFYDIEQLPTELMESQRKFIALAAQDFAKRRSD